MLGLVVASINIARIWLNELSANWVNEVKVIVSAGARFKARWVVNDDPGIQDGQAGASFHLSDHTRCNGVGTIR